MAARNTSSHTKKWFHSNGSSPEPEPSAAAPRCIPVRFTALFVFYIDLFHFPRISARPPLTRAARSASTRPKKWRREGRSRFLPARHWRPEGDVGGGRRWACDKRAPPRPSIGRASCQSSLHMTQRGRGERAHRANMFIYTSRKALYRPRSTLTRVNRNYWLKTNSLW